MSESFSPPYPNKARGYADVQDLQPHPKNDEIYDDRNNTDLVKRINENGFRESQRLLICSDGTILSGHRRWVAAIKAGLDRVPIEVRDIDPTSDEAILELLTANDYRDKTPAEKIREGELWEEIEREDAKEREQSGGVENFPQGDTGKSRDKVGEKIGVSGRTYEKGKQVKEKAEQGDETAQKEWEKLETGDQSIHGAYKTVKREEEKQANKESVKEAPDIPEGKYSIILADPPWQYDHQSTPNREIERHYATMDLDDIKELDIPKADESVCYLWTTAPKLEEGLEVLNAWGFKYITNAVWDKQKIGMGYWFRGQHELLLVGKSGSMSPPDTANRRSSVIESKRGKHSEKPTQVYDFIENAFPDEPKVELFARGSRDGWETWGDDVD